MAEEDLTVAVVVELGRNFERRLRRSSFLDEDQVDTIMYLFYQAQAVTAIEVMGNRLLEGFMTEVRIGKRQ